MSEVGNERLLNPWLQPKENTTCGTPSGRREPERVSDREIANQSAGRIFTAGDTHTTALLGHQRESAGRIFTSWR